MAQHQAHWCHRYLSLKRLCLWVPGSMLRIAPE
jgi:hypothetical protein